VSPPEIGFLALGLALGTTAGAALLAVVRPHAPLRPVVKVTITPNALAPRETAAARTTRAYRLAETLPGSPDEEARLDLRGAPAMAVPTTPAPSETRTRVPFGSATLPDLAVAPSISGGAQPAGRPLASAAPVAIAVAAWPEAGALSLDDPGFAEPVERVDVGATRVGLAVRPRPPIVAAQPRLAVEAVGIPVIAGPPLDRPAAVAVAAVGDGRPAASAGAGASDAADRGAASPAADPCADDRTAAAAACAAAESARAAARTAADRLRDAQRAHADLEARVEEAVALADPRRVAAEKERLHSQFRATQRPTISADEAEAAAREWLTAVSNLNAAARDAARRARAGTEELRTLAASVEQLDLEASAARIAADRAEDACRTARESLATCEERQRAVPPAAAAGEGLDEDRWPGGAEPAFDRRPSEPDDAGRLPVILRVLGGEAGAREQLVEGLAAGDPAQTAAWHVRIASFVDAVTARAIEDGYIEVREDDPFWRLFSGEEQREIVQALSALGFRFDGMHGFADDRAPTARDLSLAVGYAGLDRMRVRNWPGEAGLAELFDGAVVRADLWLATQADDLSLARVEAALGPRAASLAELWDAWGRVRPAMLEER
jgi:hypothetical protein